MNNQAQPKLAHGCAGHGAISGPERRNLRSLAALARMSAFLAELTSEKRTLSPEVYSLAPGAKRTKLQNANGTGALDYGSATASEA